MVESKYIRKIIAPLVLSLFAIGWYQFSKIYLTHANDLALSNANFAVYVQTQQFDGYLTATRYICYAIVYLGLILFWYNLVKFVEVKEKHG
ncbi:MULTISPECIES: hypothetical protein [Sulfolobaceae]|uniref:Uncharacterized protein n=1 Tax=Saccharolobus islandicus (strain M.14.25 / Kamchatka \|nr:MULTISPECIES: hypothetical protein [Sulfolobus]ACP39239.1 conserved hypothetical protein [Sulfolobus islandicus M.14.25]QIW23733.1 hypothetical protein EWF20_05885 [Sulfolobus sp. S-194]